MDVSFSDGEIKQLILDEFSLFVDLWLNEVGVRGCNKTVTESRDVDEAHVEPV